MNATPEIWLAGAIRPVVERTQSDAFDNAIRAFGVLNACEWFGHSPHDDEGRKFMAETAKVLAERTLEGEKT